MLTDRHLYGLSRLADCRPDDAAHALVHLDNSDLLRVAEYTCLGTGLYRVTRAEAEIRRILDARNPDAAREACAGVADVATMYAAWPRAQAAKCPRYTLDAMIARGKTLAAAEAEAAKATEEDPA